MIPSTLRAAIDELNSLGDRATISEALIDIANRFSEVAPSQAVRPFPEANRVKACESEAYVFATKGVDGGIALAFAVENPQGISAKALSTLLQESLSGQPLAAIQQIPEDLVYEIFGRTVSMGRGAGLMGIITMMKDQARRADELR
jgi:cysteine desulfuration protein SufE